jgi:UDP-glucuronate 4-epimerase
MDFIKAIEAKTGISAEINYKPMQAGDIHKTYADVEDLFSLLEFKPKTSIEDGVSQFVDWYKSFYKV